VRQDRVLLSAIPAMDLVDEDDGLPAFAIERVARFLHRRAQISDARRDRGERLEDRAGLLCEQQRNRGLAGPGRAPEDYRM